MLIKIIKKFIKLNLKASNALTEKYPRFFYENGNYLGELNNLIKVELSSRNIKKVLELGGVDRPLLKQCSTFQYIGMDIEERPDCKTLYDEFIKQDVQDEFVGYYDLVISTTLLEHVADNAKTFTNIKNVLAVNGKTIHYVPSKWHPYAVLTRVVGHNIQKLLISIIRPEAAGVTGYKAYYDKCFGPELNKLLDGLGYKNIEIKYYYRANSYFKFFFPAYIIISAFENISRRLQLRLFASGMIVYAEV